MLTRETFRGPWAGLPVAWNAEGNFDELTYRGDVRRCCEAGIPGVYSGGTSGEFYAIEIDEFLDISRATVEECHANETFAMIGCSSTSTTGSVRRAKMARELGADAIQVTLPFWMEVGDTEVVPFFQAVAEAAEGLPFSIYETKRCKKTLTIEQHRAVKEAVPSYLMSKSNFGTIGWTPEGCRELSEFVNVFVAEPFWKELGPCGAAGACSAMVYWNPSLILNLWSSIERKDWDAIDQIHAKIDLLHQFLAAEFGSRGFTDSAYDKLAGNALGILDSSLRCRGPYPSPDPDDSVKLYSWCEKHFPEILNHSSNK